MYNRGIEMDDPILENMDKKRKQRVADDLIKARRALDTKYAESVEYPSFVISPVGEGIEEVGTMPSFVRDDERGWTRL